VALLEGLDEFSWKGRHEEGVAVGPAHHRERHFPSCVGDLDDGLAEVELVLARRLGERHEDLRVATSALRDQCANLALQPA
jgi:hypothetical protein